MNKNAQNVNPIKLKRMAFIEGDRATIVYPVTVHFKGNDEKQNQGKNYGQHM